MNYLPIFRSRYDDRYDADANRLFRQLNWKDLSTQFQMQEALMVYKL